MWVRCGFKLPLIIVWVILPLTGYDAMRAHLNQPFTTYDQDNEDWNEPECYYKSNETGCYYDYYSHSRYYSDGNCADLHEGAWWYKHRSRVSSPGGCDHSTTCNYYIGYKYYVYNCCVNSNCNSCGSYAYSCAYSNLNGRVGAPKGKNIIWHGLPGNDCGIKFTEMKIRPLP